jgi:shikimate kinase
VLAYLGKEGKSMRTPPSARSSLITLAPFPLDKTLALVGMPATGKTTVGKQLAHFFKVEFVDSDTEVEKSAGGNSVSVIYDQWGEEAFRDAEYQVIKRLFREKPIHVLATGEGAFAQEETRKFLQENAITIFINTNLDIVCERIQRKLQSRPQLAQGDILENIKKTWQQRSPFYRLADIEIKSDDTSYEDTLTKIITALSKFLYLS